MIFLFFRMGLEEFDIVFNFLNTSAARVRKMRHSVEKMVISQRFLGKIGSQAYFFCSRRGKMRYLFCFPFPFEEFDIDFGFLNTSAARMRKMRHSVENIIISPRF